MKTLFERYLLTEDTEKFDPEAPFEHSTNAGEKLWMDPDGNVEQVSEDDFTHNCKAFEILTGKSVNDINGEIYDMLIQEVGSKLSDDMYLAYIALDEDDFYAELIDGSRIYPDEDGEAYRMYLKYFNLLFRSDDIEYYDRLLEDGWITFHKYGYEVGITSGPAGLSPAQKRNIRDMEIFNPEWHIRSDEDFPGR